MNKSPSFTRSLPLLRSPHWLLVKCRILFKISLLTCKTLHEKQPVYLHSMLVASLPSHSLRSNKGITLSVPRVKTNTGTRAFHSRAPSLMEQPAGVCPFSHFSCYIQETSKDTFPRLGLSPIDTSKPDGPLM